MKKRKIVRRKKAVACDSKRQRAIAALRGRMQRLAFRFKCLEADSR
jgi:hypothetical protein